MLQKSQLYERIRNNRPPNVKRINCGQDRLVRLSLSKAEEVLISFIDRYGSSGYIYHPIRRGTLFEVWERDERVYFRIRLGDFVALRPEVALDATQRIQKVLKGPPARVGDDPEASNDGFYALQGADVLQDKDMLKGESAWLSNADQLSKTKAFGGTQDKPGPVLFLRTELFRPKVHTHPMTPLQSGSLDQFELRKGTMYELRLSYRYPAHTSSEPVPATLGFSNGDELQVLETGPLPINASADDLALLFATKRYAEDRYSFLRIEPGSSPSGTTVSGPSLLGPRLNLPMVVIEGRVFWVKVILALFLFALAGLVLGVDANTFAEKGITEIPRTILEKLTWVRVLAALTQAGMLFGLFWLIGKKPV